MSISLTNYIALLSSNITDAMKIIDTNSVGLVYIVDAEKHLVGCLTDGDIRRWLLKGGRLDASVSDVMNRTPIYIKSQDVESSFALMTKNQIYSVPVVDDTMKVNNIVFLDSHMKMRVLSQKIALKDTSVIIMAGGKGTRLYPYTRILPKPLIPIGDIPILERILDRFYKFGAKDFLITVNYKKEMIKSYFSESEHPYNITYVNEDEPYGTAGSISLIDKKFDSPVFISNCDIIIVAEYDGILKHHCKSGNDMTIVSSIKSTMIPYGVLKTGENGNIVSMEEKPILSHLVNTGMYVVNPDCLEMIPKGVVYHMTDLAEQMIRNGMKVGIYPIGENAFLDMGQFEEMKRMEEKLAEIQE